MGANRVRITGGAFRSRMLRFPDAPGLRPSGDRVRETLFNWLGQDLTGLRCLDLFAGSGALGFECLSRNAAAVAMVEKDARVHAALLENARLLGVEDRLELVRGDALGYLSRLRAPVDLLLLDPPFHAGWFDRLLPLVAAAVAADGRLYVETEAPPPVPAGFSIYRQGRSGAVCYTLMARA